MFVKINQRVTTLSEEDQKPDTTSIAHKGMCSELEDLLQLDSLTAQSDFEICFTEALQGAPMTSFIFQRTDEWGHLLDVTGVAVFLSLPWVL